MCLSSPLFRQTGPKKMCESYTRERRAVWRLPKGLASTQFWRNFHQIYVSVPAKRKKVYHTNRPPKN
jgi:hypothetical protein